MKRITRMLIFSGVAIFLTSLWDKGFLVNFHFAVFLKTLVIVAIFYYIVMPITKLILLPINFLTLGLVSTLVYFLLFYFFITRFSLINIKDWNFSGYSLNNFSISKMHIGYLFNVILSSFSLSFIINCLEALL